MAEERQMDRRTTDSLARFCIGQCNAFDARAWLARSDFDAQALSFAAKYLSLTSWYGHEEELEQIAAKTRATAAENSAGLYEEAKAIHFDLPCFSATVRTGIARQGMRRTFRQTAYGTKDPDSQTPRDPR